MCGWFGIASAHDRARCCGVGRRGQVREIAGDEVGHVDEVAGGSIPTGAALGDLDQAVDGLHAAIRQPAVEGVQDTVPMCRDCQRRSKIRPRGGAKLGHFGFTRDAGDERRPVSCALHVAGG